jgi:hypothetical protein
MISDHTMTEIRNLPVALSHGVLKEFLDCLEDVHHPARDLETLVKHLQKIIRADRELLERLAH